MSNKEYYFNWFFVFAISSIFAINYFYFFSNEFLKDQKINDLISELDNMEKLNFELSEELIKLRREIGKKEQGSNE